MASQQKMLTPQDTWSGPFWELSHLKLACVLMLRSFSPELVMFSGLCISNIPQYIYFAFQTIQLTSESSASVYCYTRTPWLTSHWCQSHNPTSTRETREVIPEVQIIRWQRHINIITCINTREKGRDLTQSYDKTPTPTEKKNKTKRNETTQKCHKKLWLHNDCWPLRIVSRSNNSLPTGVVKTSLRALNLPTNHNSRVIKRTHKVNELLSLFNKYWCYILSQYIYFTVCNILTNTILLVSSQ